MKTSGGRSFTLVELMIVIAIVAVLAAIAVPKLVHMQLMAKRAEITTNAPGIADVAMMYFTGSNTWANTAGTDPFFNWHPRVVDELDKTAVAWVDTAEWTDLGWRPDGLVRGGYTTSPGFTGAGMVMAGTDLDNDDVIAYTILYIGLDGRVTWDRGCSPAGPTVSWENCF